jgi:ATPase subunit of ABC transporter with duplicated ATPase domains
VARERKAAKSELAQLATERDRRAHEAARADARRSKRHLNPRDRSAKAAIDLAIYSGQDGKAGRRSAQLDSRLKAAEQRVAEAFVPKTYDGAFWLDAHPSHRRVIARLAANAIPLYAPAGGAARSATAWTTECPLEGAHVSLSSEASHARTLFFPELIVGPTDHIGLSGPNGSGKSTLIRALVAALPDDLATLYLPQELTATETRTLLRRIKALAPPQRGQLLSLVARLNSDPDRILSGDMTSPGELRKLLLAEGALNAPQLIIADEPTNHLDLSSIEALEVVLAACPCALILVSHDAPFLAATTTLSWRIETEEASGSRLRVSGA